mmetsp:Transcript_43151/g.71938  ORF Transcript_43151/g.71938 Transcript_43151/m.71938 type:complete len:109 (+) Transcript_43151:1303-1629(+)
MPVMVISAGFVPDALAIPAMKVARNSASKVEFEKEEMSKEPKVIADETMVVVLVVGASVGETVGEAVGENVGEMVVGERVVGAAVVGEAVGAAVVGETVRERVVGAQV